MQYTGDAKHGRLVGTDQCVLAFLLTELCFIITVVDRFGNRYFENMNAEEEIPGRHRWVDFAQVCVLGESGDVELH